MPWAHGQGRRFRQRPARPRGRDSLGDRPLDGLHDPSDGHELAGQPSGERRILADRQTLAISANRPGRERRASQAMPPSVAARRNRGQRRRTGHGEDANPRTRLWARRPWSRCRPSERFARASPARAAIPEPGGAHRQERRPLRPPRRNPPRHAGRSPLEPRPAIAASTSAICKSTNEDSAPPHPPASLPATISPLTPAAIARLISAFDVTSREHQPAARHESQRRPPRRMARSPER